jgi:hypothetical protein
MPFHDDSDPPEPIPQSTLYTLITDFCWLLLTMLCDLPYQPNTALELADNSQQ